LLPRTSGGDRTRLRELADPASIARQFGLKNRSTLCRHAHALGLFSKRQRNVRAALEKIIERAGEVEVNATAVVSAVAAYSRLNAAGQWVERSERIDLNQLFDRMTALELEQYARDGKLPDWFTSVILDLEYEFVKKIGNRRTASGLWMAEDVYTEDRVYETFFDGFLEHIAVAEGLVVAVPTTGGFDYFPAHERAPTVM
jgi:hypothetical protein